MPAISAANGLSASEIYRPRLPSVVELKVVKAEENPYVNNGAPQDVTGAGSGFVYDRSGFIVTNDHVVDGAKAITVMFPNNKTFKAHIVGGIPTATSP